MAIILASKTLQAINDGLEKDQGAAYRVALGTVIPHIGDAYRGVDPNPFRSHLGASVAGADCARAIWYGFRWATMPKFEGRILRLFNRGHLEEARFIALLLSIGVQIFQQDENGRQFRISDLGGHLGGSGDGVGIGIPDIPSGMPCLLEFKTHGSKSYIKVEKEGVQSAKFEHYVQMQLYLRKMNLQVALYGAVNKDNDHLHLEIVPLDIIIADQFIDRAKQIIMLREAPRRINESPGWFGCKFCSHKPVCHLHKPIERNCRTCHYVKVIEDGTWQCGQTCATLSTEAQLAACDKYLSI
jgi:hypothetical protein